MPNTLVIDTGTDIIGIYSVEESLYVPYRGAAMRVEALPRILSADEVVSYNGNSYDLKELGKLAGRTDGLPIKLESPHSDMREICWSNRIWGKSLRDTYEYHFPEGLPNDQFDDPYVDSNWCDVYMTYKLWERWKGGTLKVLDGNYRD